MNPIDIKNQAYEEAKNKFIDVPKENLLKLLDYQLKLLVKSRHLLDINLVEYENFAPYKASIKGNVYAILDILNKKHNLDLDVIHTWKANQHQIWTDIEEPSFLTEKINSYKTQFINFISKQHFLLNSMKTMLEKKEESFKDQVLNILNGFKGTPNFNLALGMINLHDSQYLKMTERAKWQFLIDHVDSIKETSPIIAQPSPKKGLQKASNDFDMDPSFDEFSM